MRLLAERRVRPYRGEASIVMSANDSYGNPSHTFIKTSP